MCGLPAGAREQSTSGALHHTYMWKMCLDMLSSLTTHLNRCPSTDTNPGNNAVSNTISVHIPELWAVCIIKQFINQIRATNTSALYWDEIQYLLSVYTACHSSMCPWSGASQVAQTWSRVLLCHQLFRTGFEPCQGSNMPETGVRELFVPKVPMLNYLSSMRCKATQVLWTQHECRMRCMSMVTQFHTLQSPLTRG